MVAFLITSLLVLAGITYAIYLWQRPSATQDNPHTLPPATPVGLFDDQLNRLELPAGGQSASEQRDLLFERAKAGEKAALDEAWATKDKSLYDDVLNLLVERSNSDKAILALVSYIVRSDSDLRVNRRLAERFVDNWKTSPDRNNTAKMLHVAALADDADLYHSAVDAAHALWQAGNIEQLSADELRQLIESEFWLLSSETRASGAGFLLKRRLAQVRRGNK